METGQEERGPTHCLNPACTAGAGQADTGSYDLNPVGGRHPVMGAITCCLPGCAQALMVGFGPGTAVLDLGS